MTAMWNRNLRRGLAVLGLCGVLTGSQVLQAQDAQQPASPQEQGSQAPGQGGGRRPGPERMQERQLQMLTRELQLTPEQVDQVKKIQADTMQEMTALRDQGSAEQQDRRAKMMAIRQASREKVRAILTQEQRSKFDDMQARMKQRRQDEGNGPMVPPAPPAGGSQAPPPAPPQR